MKIFTKNRGFTLVELITVLVILGIIAALGSSFVVSMINSYKDVQQRTKLINKGRAALEQMTRQLRFSVPNSVRVSASGNCVEFLPLLTGGNYIGELPDSENFAPSVTSFTTAPFVVNSGTPEHVVVGGLDATEIYSTGSPNARVDAGAIASGTVNLANSHSFIRNSINRRFFVAADPVRFCLFGTTLNEYSAYGFSTAGLGDLNPGGATAVLSEDVSSNSQAFRISQGTEDINTSLFIDLQFTQGDNQVELNQQVVIRNVP